MNIGIALFADAEELDSAGPWEVLSFWAREWPEDGVTVFSIADELAPLVCAKGLHVVPDRAWQDVQSLDVLVYPGGRGTRSQLEPGDPIHERLRGLAAVGTLVTSVCTGSLVFAAAGLLRDRPVARLHSTDRARSVRRGIEYDPQPPV